MNDLATALIAAPFVIGGVLILISAGMFAVFWFKKRK